MLKHDTDTGNILHELSTPCSDENSTQIARVLDELEEKKIYFSKVEEENLKLKEEIQKYRASFKDMKNNMLQNE